MKQKENGYMERASYAWSQDSVRLFANASQTARAIYFYVQEAGYFKTRWPYFTERRNLNSFLILYTISGTGSLTYGDREYLLTAGSCFFIHCMEYQEYHTCKDENWEFLWLHFNGCCARGYYEEFVKNGFQILTGMEQTGIRKLLEEIVALTEKREASAEIRISERITGLLTELIIQNTVGDRQITGIPDYVRQAKKHLEQNFTQKNSLEELAGICSVSKFHLAKEFSRYVGVPPYEYLIGVRLSYAKELLQYSDKSVSEIAYASGMNHVSQFIKLFKQREEKTPLQYRKEWNSLR